MSEGQDEERVSPWRSLSFWNRFAAITLGYGGVNAWLLIRLQRAIGGFAYLEQLNAIGKAAIVLIAGSIGMHAMRSRFFAPDEWAAVRQAALALSIGLVALCAASGELPMAITSLLCVGVHVIAVKVMKD